jgi:hypothetical protein
MRDSHDLYSFIGTQNVPGSARSNHASFGGVSSHQKPSNQFLAGTSLVMTAGIATRPLARSRIIFLPLESAASYGKVGSW